MANRKVCAVVLDAVVTFDLACAVQAFARAAPDATLDGFDLTVCGMRRGMVATIDGFGLRVAHGLEAMAEAEIVIVPARLPHNEPPPRKLTSALREAHERGAIIASICLGAFTLAQAGLLDGRRATTHWAYCEELSATFPRIDVQPARLYVDEGDVLTSAGLAAGLDLCLHIVRREAGAATAGRIARWNVIAPHREGGQAQFIPPSSPADPLAEDLGALLAWARERLHEPLPLARLATRCHLSERTLNRRFQAALGTTPKRWIIDQRVALARELLEDSKLEIETVAQRAGFPSTAALRAHLRASTAMTPSGYRRTFAPE